MYKKIIFAFIFLFSTIALLAQEALSLEDYRTRVVEYSQELKQAQQGVIAAEAERKAIKTGFLPKLALVADGNYQLNTPDFNFSGTPMGLKPWGYSVGATISQNIYRGNSIRNQYNAAKIGEEIAYETEKLTIDNILYMSDIYYWTFAANIGMLEVAEKNVQLINDLYLVVKNRFDDGLISRNDLLMVETRKMEAELQRSNIRKRHNTSLINFNLLMGIPNGTIIILLDHIEKPILVPELIKIEEALKFRPEYQMAQKQILVNQYSLNASLAQFRPQITAGFTGSYGSKAINFDGSSMGNGIVFGQVSVPIFEWNKKKHIKAIGNSSINNSMFNQVIIKDKISGEVHTSWVNMTQSESELELANSTLSIAQQSLDINTLSYNEGRLTILDVLTSQLSWLLSFNNVIATNLQLKTSYSQYNKSTGAYNK